MLGDVTGIGAEIRLKMLATGLQSARTGSSETRAILR
jgi:hypothetical protein